MEHAKKKGIARRERVKGRGFNNVEPSLGRFNLPERVRFGFWTGSVRFFNFWVGSQAKGLFFSWVNRVGKRMK